MITTASHWRSLGNVTPEFWRTRLVSVQSPIAEEWQATYDAAYPHTVLALAMLEVESRYATRFNANRPENRNPLNLRPPAGDGYLAFATYAEAIQAWRDRVTSPTYKGGVYDKTDTILELIERYAPANDSNDPSAYAAIVAARASTWKAEEPMAITAEPCPIETYVAWDGPNRPGLVMPSPSKIVTHEVGNQSPGADEDMHRRFVLAGGGEFTVSFHFVVGPTKIVQLLYLDENAWHASDGYFGDGNRDAWGIEHIQIGDFAKTLAHGAWLQAELARNPRRFAIKNPAAFVQDITPANLRERMVQHNWEAPDGKNCPQFIRERGLWPGFVGAAVTEAKQGSLPAPYPITWEPGDVGPQTIGSEKALAMLAEVTAKRTVPLRQGASGKSPKVGEIKQGARVRLVGTLKNSSAWYFVELPDKPGTYGRALRSAFWERFPTI